MMRGGDKEARKSGEKSGKEGNKEEMKGQSWPTSLSNSYILFTGLHDVS